MANPQLLLGSNSDHSAVSGPEELRGHPGGNMLQRVDASNCYQQPQWTDSTPHEGLLHLSKPKWGCMLCHSTQDATPFSSDINTQFYATDLSPKGGTASEHRTEGLWHHSAASHQPYPSCIWCKVNKDTCSARRGDYPCLNCHSTGRSCIPSMQLFSDLEKGKQNTRIMHSHAETPSQHIEDAATQDVAAKKPLTEDQSIFSGNHEQHTNPMSEHCLMSNENPQKTTPQIHRTFPVHDLHDKALEDANYSSLSNSHESHRATATSPLQNGQYGNNWKTDEFKKFSNIHLGDQSIAERVTDQLSLLMFKSTNQYPNSLDELYNYLLNSLDSDDAEAIWRRCLLDIDGTSQVLFNQKNHQWRVAADSKEILIFILREKHDRAVPLGQFYRSSQNLDIRPITRRILKCIIFLQKVRTQRPDQSFQTNRSTVPEQALSSIKNGRRPIGDPQPQGLPSFDQLTLDMLPAIPVAKLPLSTPQRNASSAFIVQQGTHDPSFPVKNSKSNWQPKPKDDTYQTNGPLNLRNLPSRTCSGNNLLPSRLKSGHQNKCHVCETCGKKFRRHSMLLAHIRSHTGEKPFSCSDHRCGKRFSVDSNRKRHERNYHSLHSQRLKSTTNFPFVIQPRPSR